MSHKIFRKLLLLLLQAFLFMVVVSSVGCTTERQKSVKNPGYGSLISSKWKLRDESNGVQYFLEFKDSLYIAQYFRQYNAAVKMYPGEWHVNGDTIFIDDRRGNFQALFRELTDSVMILMRTDSVNLLFDRLPSGFDWEQ